MPGYNSQMNQGYNEEPGVNWGRIAAYTAGGVMALGLTRMGLSRMASSKSARAGIAKTKGLAAELAAGWKGDDGLHWMRRQEARDAAARPTRSKGGSSFSGGGSRKTGGAVPGWQHRQQARTNAANKPQVPRVVGAIPSVVGPPNIMPQVLTPQSSHFLQSVRAPSAASPASGPFEGFANAREGAFYGNPFSPGYTGAGLGPTSPSSARRVSPFQSENMGGRVGGNVPSTRGLVSPFGSPAAAIAPTPSLAAPKSGGGGRKSRKNKR